MVTQCDFCNELSGGLENSFSRIYGSDHRSRVLLRSDNFAVAPSLGQISEGYLLVFPIEHVTALGDLQKSYLNQLAAITRSVGEALTSHYGPYILFEHGTRFEGVGGCGIYHAHLHAMPLPGITDPVDALKLRFPYTELAHVNQINKQSAGLPSYLFYQDSATRLYLFDTGPLPSQYMRRILADTVGHQDWDWRAAGKEDRLLATIERLAGKLETESKLIR